MSTLQKLVVLADPEHASKHPYHDTRFICVEGTTFEEQHENEWVVSNPDGRIVAKMTDTKDQAEYAHLFAASLEMRDALRATLSALEGWLEIQEPHDARQSDESAVKLARLALAKADPLNPEPQPQNRT